MLSLPWGSFINRLVKSVAIIAIGIVLAGGVGKSEIGRTLLQTPAARLGSVAFAFLTNGHLVGIESASGSLVTDRSLTPVVHGRPPAHVIAQSQDRQSLFVLAPAPDNLLFRYDIKGGLSHPVEGLEDADYRSIETGPATGRLYVFGNYNDNRGLIVSILDPIAEHVVATFRATLPDRDWRVYQGGVSSDERRLFFSYHGGADRGTTGIDWFDVTADALKRCDEHPRNDTGCIPAHGGFSRYHDDLLVATGQSLVFRAKPGADMGSGFDTGLNRNHLMEFALDTRNERLFAVGSCLYVPGFSTVDLQTQGQPVSYSDGLPKLSSSSHGFASTPIMPEVCGERLAFGADNRLAVAAKSAIFLIDTESQKTIHTVYLDAEPLDVFLTH